MSDNQTFSRRRFIGAGAGIAAAAAVAPKAFAQTAPAPGDPTCVPGAPQGLLPKQRIGIQLYTVRDQITSRGFAAVLEDLAKIGYKEVEFAGFNQGSNGPITAAELRTILDDNGLRATGNHSGASLTTIQQVLDDAETLGMPNVGLAGAPGGGTTKSSWQTACNTMNTMGQAAADRGIKFYWHNHDSEFNFIFDDPTTRIYDFVLAQTDPNLVFMEMDIYWAYVGQYEYGTAPFPAFNPLDYLMNNLDRYVLFHVKDGKSNRLSRAGYDMVDVGQGNIDYATFFKDLANKVQYGYLFEHDGAASGSKGSMGSSLASFCWMRYGLQEPGGKPTTGEGSS